MTLEAKKEEGAKLLKTEASSHKDENAKGSKEPLKQDNPAGMKETLKKTDRREPKKGLPINSPGRESSK